ncbi:MAG TPA: pyrimidine reductase family protein [Mycobacteriales bacterium]|nr:pyrimidine reductase family protein [Mycobacteriales bacterium]
MTTIAAIPELPTNPEELDRYYGEPPDGVRANMIMTADGAGAFAGRTKPITDDADQVLLRYLRNHADAVMIGSATVQAEHYGPVRLSEEEQATRRAAGHAPLPPLVIVTARALLPTSLRVFHGEGPRPIVATTSRSAATIGDLREVADVIAVGDADIEPETLLATLRDRGLSRILCEGGPYLLSTLVERDLVDDMCLTVSPYLAGSQPTTPQPPSALEAPSALALRHVLRHDDLLYLRYTRRH